MKMWTYLPRIIINHKVPVKVPVNKIFNQFFNSDTIKEHVSTNEDVGIPN